MRWPKIKKKLPQNVGQKIVRILPDKLDILLCASLLLIGGGVAGLLGIYSAMVVVGALLPLFLMAGARGFFGE